MKKVACICCLLLFTVWSCTQKEETEGTIEQKPAGKYVSEIRTGMNSSETDAGLKVAEFVYDDNRYLTAIKYYIPETQQLQRHSDLFYNTDGTLNHIEVNYSGSNAMIDERFTYENKNLTMIEGYKIEDSKTMLVAKSEFKVDAINHTVEIMPYDLKDGVLVKRAYAQKYYFNENGNLIKYHYNIGQGGFFETMEDFEYDNRFNPFGNLEIPYYNIVSSYFSLGECFSAANVVRHTNYLYENGVSYKKPDFDTIIYQYEGNYPVASAEYHSWPDAPLELKSVYFFKYVDLK